MARQISDLSLAREIKKAIGYFDRVDECSNCTYFNASSPGDNLSNYPGQCSLHKETLGFLEVQSDGVCHFHYQKRE